MFDVVTSSQTGSAEGWSLTATGLLELLYLPFTGNSNTYTSIYITFIIQAIIAKSR